MDTCYTADKALENSLLFAESRFDISAIPTSSDIKKPSKASYSGRIIGVLGPTASEDSVKVATLLKLFKIPQISYFSTSPELSDSNIFPYFLRTVPSDLYQAKAITSILRYYQWSYVTMIYEDTSYGKNIAEVLTDLAEKNDICIGFQQSISESVSPELLESIASILLRHSNTNSSLVRKEVNDGNTWFKEYWESKFNCSFGNSSHESVNCTGDEEFVDDKDVTEYETLFNGRNAVFTYGQALISAHNEFCHDLKERCEGFDEVLADGSKLFAYLKNVKETEGIQNQDKTGTKANKQKPPPYEKKRTPDMGVRPGAQEE
ncbi:hypothetical protein FSP39_009992 [Pinctada imbricata]|uniref:Receptor ligand binding region domain-containing protein n=1 Tax=Pinctada imbricata TaxID=66713 RepID=A0AA89C1E7_PINIB|nr:hypothetical protein FSP39_009992 [Pinctada imbricata]